MMSTALDQTYAYVPPRYPAHLVESGRLRDGTDIAIRPIRPEDDAMERAFIRGLSRDTGYNRLLSGRKLTPEEIWHLTRIDYDREMAFIAVTVEDGQARLLGVARYVRDADGSTDARDADASGAEFAIVIADAWQHKGVGTLLLGTLLRHAHAAGIGRLHGITLASNQAMQNLARKLGFVQQRDPRDASVRYVEKTLATEVLLAAAGTSAGYPGNAAANDEGISVCNPLLSPDSVQDGTENITEIA